MKAHEFDSTALQADLDGKKSQKERNQLGQFATPPALASEVLSFSRQFTGDARIRFLDPAFGIGAFYAALLSCYERSQITRAVAFEIDSHYGNPAAELWRETPLEFRLEDFTISQIPEQAADKFNLLICNPPYVRHHHLSLVTKNRLAKRAADSAGVHLNGLAGLYCHFMAIAHSWMADDGIAGWLIPSEFMDVNYGSAIRKYLTESVQLLHIHRFDPAELQFGDALVSSAVVWFRKRLPYALQPPTMSYGGSLLRPSVSREVSLAELSASSKWSSLAHGKRETSISGYTLSDLFQIKRGLVSGNNKLFVITAKKAFDIGAPRAFLRPVLPSPRHLQHDVVEGDASGDPIVDKRLYLLDCGVNEQELQEQHPSVFEYLEAGRSEAVKSYICSHRNPWYSQEVRPAAPFICTYMGRGLRSKVKPFRFILNKTVATSLNVYLMMYPKPHLAKALALNEDLHGKILDKLNSIPADILLGEGRVYGGGLYKMEPKELANVPADDIMAMLNIHEKRPMKQTELFSRCR